MQKNKIDLSFFEAELRKDSIQNSSIIFLALDGNIKGFVNVVDSIKNNSIEVIKKINPDVILVMGWFYLVPKKIRDIAKYGACGIHASLLPKYAGWAPLVWAIINGEKETGVTFFQFDDSVDGGDILAQKSFAIDYHDSIKEVYEKATIKSIEILLTTLPELENIQFIKQDKSKLEIWDKRTPSDGEIDLTQSSFELYNFIRAQSSPYPGAFFKTIDGKKLIIEKARIED